MSVVEPHIARGRRLVLGLFVLAVAGVPAGVLALSVWLLA
jgi:hypothetical protein